MLRPLTVPGEAHYDQAAQNADRSGVVQVTSWVWKHAEILRMVRIEVESLMLKAVVCVVDFSVLRWKTDISLRFSPVFGTPWQLVGW